MKQKKKFGLLALFSTIAIALPALYQKMIFMIAKKKSQPAPDYQIFHWKEGDVAYETIGTGQPILLLHNTQVGANRIEWSKNIETFSNQFQVFAVDLPGYGQSEKPKLTYTAYQYTLFINDFIEQVIGKPTTVLASSASADFTIMACHLKPENFKKLVLISPLGIQSSMATNQDARRKMLLQSPIAGTQLFLQQSSKKAITNRLRHEVFFAQELVTKELIDAYYYAAHNGGENARFAYACAASSFLNSPIQQAFRSLRKPFLVVWGKENRTNPVTNLAQLEKLRPNGQYAVFDNTRMLPHYENSTAFQKAVLEFLK